MVDNNFARRQVSPGDAFDFDDVRVGWRMLW
jgi:hypothetical protein